MDHEWRMTDLHLYPMIDVLGRLLAMLVCVDEAVSGNSCIRKHWSFYLRSVHLVHRNSVKFGMFDSPIEALVNVLMKVDLQIMSGYVLQNSFPISFGSDNPTFGENMLKEFVHAVKWSKKRFELSVACDAPYHEHLVALCSLACFLHSVFNAVDQKCLRVLMECCRKAPVVVLCNCVAFCPAKFLLRKISVGIRSFDIAAFDSSISQHPSLFQQRCGDVKRAFERLRLAVLRLQLEVGGFRRWQDNSVAELQRRNDLFLNGLSAAAFVGEHVRTLLALISEDAQFIDKRVLLLLFRIVDQLKARTVPVHFVREACDCSFVAFYRSLVPLYFGLCLKSTEVSYVLDLQSFFAALNDSCKMLRDGICHEADAAATVFEHDVWHEFEQVLMRYLCQEVENDLRLSLFSESPVENEQRFSNHKLYYSLIHHRPIYFSGKYLDISGNYSLVNALNQKPAR
ncbi:unnamed protein product [Soboliphyme baturini]|uniref:WASH-7_N domain-containing protein n=1 Tax=Soboliphyme baturini TaxID=241478 RepID=A0A183IUF7_9BILA|nr:unnamed protein product [Soboliphyme baturini]